MEDVADEHKIAFDVFERESEEDGTVDISSLPDLLRKVFKILFAPERHQLKICLAMKVNLKPTEE